MHLRISPIENMSETREQHRQRGKIYRQKHRAELRLKGAVYYQQHDVEIRARARVRYRVRTQQQPHIVEHISAEQKEYQRIYRETHRDRIKWGTFYFEIVGITNPSELYHHLEIQARELVD